jgi:hypothetical protein
MAWDSSNVWTKGRGTVDGKAPSDIAESFCPLRFCFGWRGFLPTNDVLVRVGRDQYDKGLSVWSSRADFALFSRNLSAECRMRRRNYALAALVFLVFLGLGMVTLHAGYQLGIFPESRDAG